MEEVTLEIENIIATQGTPDIRPEYLVQNVYNNKRNNYRGTYVYTNELKNGKSYAPSRGLF